MKKIINARWAILAVWLVATILLTVFQPNVNNILRNRGSQALGKNSPSVVADKLLKKMEVVKGSDDIIVFYDKNKLSTQELSQIHHGVIAMTEGKKELGIDKIIDPFTMVDAKASLISRDGTTLMISFKLNKGSRNINDIKKQFDSKLAAVKSEYYYSGEDFINDDYQSAAESGVTKSAKLTVLFILFVLVLMFRSVVTPLISLVAVAFSYLCSMGIAAQLIDKAGFPVTSLTQMLLILILFGIGTDYNILLFNRFKEELANGHSTDDAIVNTYKTAGKTIAFSILTVFIAFLSLIFAESPIYRSGIVVVIGTAVLLLEILTLTPLAMKTLGNKLFWPSKKATGHKESKVWGKISSISTKHPIVSIAVILLIIGPMILSYQAKLNFDTIGELGNSHPSSKGFNMVAQHFGRGQAMPASVVIQNNSPLDNNAALAVIDNLTEGIKRIKGVRQVSSITQPQGKQIDFFYKNKTFSIPKEALTAPGFEKVLNNYLSKDRKITKLIVILNYDPYSTEATKAVKKINDTVAKGLAGTVLSNAKSGVSGPSATTNDMNNVLSRDLNRTAVIVLIGVFLVLVLVTRSLWSPVCITGSLVGAYFAGMFLLNRLFLDVKGYEGISSFVPFFSFIVIVSLGVDYSIFLMTRFKEYPELSPREAIVKASKQIGGVVMSAGVILGGTFATLMPSGLVLMEELGAAVITGLVVLCFVLLPVFLPAMIALPDALTRLFLKNKSGREAA